MELTSLTIKDRPKSLVQIAQDAIRRGIIQKELKLGQPLKEAALARPLQISNTPVREALSSKSRGTCGFSASQGLPGFHLKSRGVGGLL